MKYWGNDQEEAIVIFNTSESTEEKHKVYVTTIQPAFKKLVENIYFTYNFNKMLPDFDQIEHELVTHLYEKIDRFDVTKGKKSYSFFGTISKNWLIQKSNSKKRMSFLDGNNKDTVIQDISLSTAEKEEIQKELKEFLSHLPLFLNENKFKKDLNGEDKLVLGIISDILENYHMQFRKKLAIY